MISNTNVPDSQPMDPPPVPPPARLHLTWYCACCFFSFPTSSRQSSSSALGAFFAVGDACAGEQDFFCSQTFLIHISDRRGFGDRKSWACCVLSRVKDFSWQLLCNLTILMIPWTRVFFLPRHMVSVRGEKHMAKKDVDAGEAEGCAAACLRHCRGCQLLHQVLHIPHPFRRRPCTPPSSLTGDWGVKPRPKWKVVGSSISCDGMIENTFENTKQLFKSSF